jgi:hypothetical protein
MKSSDFPAMIMDDKYANTWAFYNRYVNSVVLHCAVV